jgi:hypothetical protein
MRNDVLSLLLVDIVSIAKEPGLSRKHFHSGFAELAVSSDECVLFDLEVAAIVSLFELVVDPLNNTFVDVVFCRRCSDGHAGG